MAIFKRYQKENICLIKKSDSIIWELADGLDLGDKVESLLSTVKDSSRELFLDEYMRNIPSEFKSEVFTIKESCELIMFNPESLRRKIRQNSLTTVNKDEVGGRVGYKVSGDTLIGICTQTSPKINIIKYCLKRYLRESLFIIIDILISRGQDMEDFFVKGLVDYCIKIAFNIKIPQMDFPQEIIPHIGISFVEKYGKYMLMRQDSMDRHFDAMYSRYNKTSKNSGVTVFQDDSATLKTNMLEKYNTVAEITRRKLELNIELVELDIKLTELRIKEIKDPTDMIKELQNRVVLEQKKSELKERLLKLGI